MPSPVLYDVSDQVALVTLNRPDRLNAWTDELGAAFAGYLEQADSDPGVRAIVLTGAGRGFCAGMDLDQLGARRVRTPEERAVAARHRTAPLRVRKPLIAAINGPAAGLGLVEALYCDVRVCAPDAKLVTAFSRLGLPAEQGVSWLLPRLVGYSRAMDLLLSGRTVLGDEAHRIGMVDFLADDSEVLARAVEYAHGLVRDCSPRAMAEIKQQVRADSDGKLEEALRTSHQLMLAAFEHPDQAEGAAAMSERRQPRFAPLD